MKYFKIIYFFLFIYLITGCAKNNIAMNSYSQNNSNYEESSGISVVVTQEMIDRVKKRAPQN